MTYGENHYSGDAPHSEIGVVIKSRPVRFLGRIRGQEVIRELR